MNILPKKRWHVRTKDNIARVRKDEALAAEEERKKQMRIELAEREARTEVLRKKARQQYGLQNVPDTPKTESEPQPNTESEPQPNTHVNLFYELERNEVVSNQTNKEYEEEKKQEKEKYEKQIGYLTYLGQDTNEMTGEVSWYNKPREDLLDKREEEISKKQKSFEDPLEDIRKYLGCEGIKKVKDSIKDSKKETKDSISRLKHYSSSKHKKKHKKEKKSKHKKKKHRHKHSSDSEESEVEIKESNVDLERLRAERIRREREERRRAEEVFARINGISVKKEEPEPEVTQKYNSQFNPHLAKQNYLNR